MLSYLWSGVTCESEGGQAQDRHTLSRWERWCAQKNHLTVEKMVREA